ncbi:MAG: hypothetical protein FGM27_05385 [Candidatus Omnitrophica bacterium]|nr:hypothetical protein [Candidatus Omnitrophota bacterium]
MSFASVFGQEEAVRILHNHIEKRRLATTYLFTGGTAESQESLAVSFVCALNDPDASPERALTPISSRIRKKIHPDVRWLGDDPKARAIKIDEVRSAIGAAGLTPFEARWKVFLISRADRMTMDSQNFLLKILEEPPAKTIFCLLAESKDTLLTTILSRSFCIRLRPGMDPMEGTLDDFRPQDFGLYRWEEFLGQYAAEPKDKLIKILDQMMFYFRRLLIDSAQNQGGGGFGSDWLEAIDLIYETKEALDANANQKLALTRLAMRLKRAIPNPDRLKV